MTKISLTLLTSAWCASGSSTSRVWSVNRSTSLLFPLYVIIVLTLRHYDLPSTSYQFTLYVNITYPLRHFTQKGHPLPTTNACQLLLKYILLNRMSFIKGYHNRVYSFSSGTKFLECTPRLDKWMDAVKSQREEDPTIEDPRTMLKRLVNFRNLYSILGDTIIEFMRLKPEPYLRNALLSKEHFWEVPEYKRAMTFVFLISSQIHTWVQIPKDVEKIHCYRSKNKHQMFPKMDQARV